MTSAFRPFRSSNLWVQCEQCRMRVNLSAAGACERCTRVLCNSHLHGSFLRRLKVDLGAPAVCLACRERGTA